MATTAKGLTLEEFLKLPEEKPALEYQDGMVVQKVSPQGKHSVLQSWFVQHIDRVGRPRKLACAFPELRTTFAGMSRVPDVAVYRWARIARDADGRVANEFREPPDLVVEIVSPEQSVNALVSRCVWFVTNGVAVALLVDPDDESILVFRPGQMPVTLRGDDPLDLGDILSGFQVTVAKIFAALLLG